VVLVIPNAAYAVLVEIAPMVFLFILVAILLRFFSIVYGHAKANTFRDFKIIIYVIYCFILFELVTSTDFESVSNNFVPFREITRYSITSPLFWRNVIGNIALFIPFSYLITDTTEFLCNKYNYFITMFISIIVSCAIEYIQMFIGRSFDIDDIILNVIGSLFGCILYAIIHKLFYKEKK